ncbi:MAG TPA: extracellular solute-binding protein [Propionicimonas sp.]|jgi:multiple sugar transport system substrate-binding protein|uniref:extracellular solute-binding protein n=1 Tax=Propionicimonas sp. TaxID=1955623 RepID=UPI002F417401
MKWKFLRPVAAAAAASLLLTGLAGCGAPAAGGSAEAVTLTWWAPNLTNSLTADEDYYKTLTAKFTKDTGIEVDVQVNAWGDYYNKILGAITSGEGADVISTGTTWVSTLSDTKAFVQFDQAKMDSIGGAGQFVPAALEAAGGNNPGGPSMIPFVSGVTAMWYNPKLLKAAGIDKPPATWPEFLADGKKLTKDTDGDGKIDQWGFGYPAGFAQEWSHTMFAFGEQNGAPFFDASGAPALDSDGMVAAAKQFIDLMNTDKIMNPSNVEQTAFGDTYQDFINGKIAILFASGANSAFDAANFTDYAPAQIPLNDPMTGKPVTSHVAGANLGVFGAGKHTAEATKLVQYLTSKDAQVDLAVHIPILPVNAEAYNSDQVKKTDVFVTAEKILKDTAASFPINPLTAQAETVVGDAMKKIMAQAATSKSMSAADIKAILTEANSQLKAAK